MWFRLGTWGSVLMVLLRFSVGCSSSLSSSNTPSSATGGSFSVSTDGGLPDVSTSKLIINTTPAERAALCDWIAGLVGGYGLTLNVACDGGTQGGGLTAEASQAVCVAGMAGYPSTCTMTVGAFEGWALSIVNHPCNYDPPVDYKAASASCVF